MAGGRHDCWIARVLVALSEAVFVVADDNNVVELDASCRWKGKASCIKIEMSRSKARPSLGRRQKMSKTEFRKSGLVGQQIVEAATMGYHTQGCRFAKCLLENGATTYNEIRGCVITRLGES